MKNQKIPIKIILVTCEDFLLISRYPNKENFLPLTIFYHSPIFISEIKEGEKLLPVRVKYFSLLEYELLVLRVTRYQQKIFKSR